MSVCLKTLAQLSKMMRGKFPALLEKYLCETDELITRLTTSDSAEERVRAAHSIKSTAASFGALHLSSLAAEYEACHGSSALAEQLRREFALVTAEFKSYLASLNEPCVRVAP
ncbi:MAG: Hpt domain-containing protein [Hahellaceae bacterium]|nr:Hpt domain-containing protein [Hahellaceae bacterium]MCP5211011.1 Hpt domain-containing protein [Hahellaceae bacterium]